MTPTHAAITADTVCECEHDRGQHDDLGNCWHMDSAGDEDCDCDQFREPAPSAGQDTERLRDELAAWLVAFYSALIEPPNNMGDGKRDAQRLLDGPLRQLIAERDQVREIHTSDGAETPFCTECGHTYPCLTIRALDGET